MRLSRRLETDNRRKKIELDRNVRQSPTVIVIAGPNGAGKTTFASEFLPEFVRCQEFINADLICFNFTFQSSMVGGYMTHLACRRG
jgi:predicted AAA+ superfamily ATPase